MAIRQASSGKRPTRTSHNTLPVVLLLPLAVVAIFAERFGRRGIAIVGTLLVLLLAVVLITPRLAGRSTSQPADDTTANAATLTEAAPADQPVAAPAATQAGVAVTAVPTKPPAAPALAAQPTTVPTPIPTAPPTQVPVAAPSAAPKNPPRGTTVIPILMYHYVRTVTDPNDKVGINLSVTPELFARQMKYLADNGYTTLTMHDLYAILNGEKTLPAKPIALTFDDGYRDFYTNAWPILKQYNFKATNYVITNFIGWNEYMTWPMLQELDATGQIELGSHTRSHPDLRALGTAQRWDELIGSKAILEQGLGHPITAFCYPAGFYNATVVADVQRAGYLNATTVEPGTKQNIQAALTMPRIRVTGPDPINVWVSRLP